MRSSSTSRRLRRGRRTKNGAGAPTRWPLSLLKPMNQIRPAKVRTLDIEGQAVRCIEEPGGKRLWLCDCAKFKERAARHPEGFCGHTAVAIMRCIEDGSIEVRL
jgi:hypothetical protein